MLRKELDALRPFIVAFGALWLINWLSIFATELPEGIDQIQHWDNDESWIGRIIWLAIPSRVLIAELESGTIELYDALPTERRTIFGVKVLAAFLAGSLLVAFDFVSRAVIFSLAQTSIATLPWDVLFITTSVDLWLVAISVAAGFCLSFLRAFLWPSLLAFGLVVKILERIWPGAGAWIDALYVPSRGVPWAPLLVQSGVALVLLGVAYVRFARSGFEGEPAHGRRWLPWALGVTFGVVLVGVWAWTSTSSKSRSGSGADRERSVEFVEFKPVVIVTKHYRFVVPSSLADRAGALAREADRMHDRVVQYLGATPSDAPIEVGYTPLASHRQVGRAHWKAISIDLPPDPKLIQRTLLHETVHVYLELMSNGALGRSFGSTRFFHEGLAQHVEHTLAEVDDQPYAVLRAAAVARKQTRIEDLVDDEALRRERDPDLAYLLGERFARAFMVRSGSVGLGRVMTAFSERQSVVLRDVDLWRDRFQHAGLDWERAVGDYHQALKRDHQTAHQPALVHVPSIEVTRQDASLRIVLGAPPPAGWRWVARVRRSASEPETSWGFGASYETAIEVSFPNAETEVEIELGLQHLTGRHSTWGDWFEVAAD